MWKTVNPATGNVIAEYVEDTADDIQKKYKRARSGFSIWSKTPFDIRKEIITSFRDLLIKNAEEAAGILSEETGKPIQQARNEIKGLPARIDFFLQNTEQVIATERVVESEDLKEEISHDPLGVVSNISAWNYPYFVGSNVFIPALLTGNTVLYKPSEYSLRTGLKIAQLLHRSGVPEDAFIPIIGSGEVGSELIKQPIDGMFFTGSYATGVKISTGLAGRMIPVQMELGGKDPVYVCDDVNIENVAAAVADGVFYNIGQSCCSVERLYVHESITKEFIDAFVKTVSELIVGDPKAEDTYIGPLTRPQQIEILEAQVQDAEAKGARVLCGGKRKEGEGNYFLPTVVVDVNHDMKIMKEESFGPVIGIQSVKDDAEAVRLMNDTEYGLTAGVYSEEEERAKRILSKVDSGSVYWNCCDRVSPQLPWTGRKHSGIGMTLSVQGIHAFVQPKAWHLKK